MVVQSCEHQDSPQLDRDLPRDDTGGSQLADVSPRRNFKGAVAMRLIFGSRISLALLALICADVAVAKADVLYSNGAPGGYGAIGINQGSQVEDSFTLSSESTLTGATFGTWLVVYKGTPVTGISVDWTIVGSEGSQTQLCPTCSGTAALTPDGSFVLANSPGYVGIDESFSLPDLDLAAGTYWLELQNETNSLDAVAVWDTSGGPSQVWGNLEGDLSGDNCDIYYGSGKCSNSFTIIGTPSSVVATPEPASLALLGTCIPLLCAEVRRRHTRIWADRRRTN